MKKYINKFLGFATIMLVLSMLPFTVLAYDSTTSSSEEIVNEINFNITSGIDVKKEKESTFDKKRTITGTSDEGTSITIYVYTAKENPEENESEDDDKDSTVTYTIIVGASGIFSQAIELAIGENTIDITVEKEDYESINKTFIINRKNREIKQELEKTIILPGEGKTSQESSLELIKR